MRKRSTSIFFSIAAMLTVFTPISYAEREPTITPYWIVTNSVESDLEISGAGQAEINANIMTMKADKVKIVAKLQRYEDGQWDLVKSWTKTEEKPTASLSGEYYVNSGYTYRLYVTYYVYQDGELVETITDKDY